MRRFDCVRPIQMRTLQLEQHTNTQMTAPNPTRIHKSLRHTRAHINDITNSAKVFGFCADTYPPSILLRKKQQQQNMRKVGTTHFGTAFSVHTIPVLRDNFSYIIQDHSTNYAALVDVSEVKPVFSCLSKIQDEKEVTLPSPYSPSFCVLTTHKHWDHCGGNKDIVREHGEDVVIYGGAKDNVPHANRPVNDRDVFKVGNLTVRVYFSPCHTSGHVLYHVTAPHDETSGGGALFTGDTLFVGGIGAFFEGNAQDMLSILDRVSAEIPKDTRIFCGHEYTVNFVKFTHSLDPHNTFIKDKLALFQSQVSHGIPTIPSTLEDELKINAFMRTRDPVIAKAVGKEGAAAVEVMQAVYDACP